MSLVQFSQRIDVDKARRFVGLIDMGLELLKFTVEKLKDDGRISGEEGMEILGKALGHHGICLGCDGHGIHVSPEPSRDYTLRLRDAGERPEDLVVQLNDIEDLVNSGVSLEVDGETPTRVSRRPAEQLA